MKKLICLTTILLALSFQAHATITIHLADGRCFTNDYQNSTYPDGEASFQGQSVYPCALAAPTEDGLLEILDRKVVKVQKEKSLRRLR